MVEAWKPPQPDQSEDLPGQNSDVSAFYIGCLVPLQ